MEKKTADAIQPYPLPLRFVLKMSFKQAWPLFVIGIILVFVYIFSFFPPLNTLPLYIQTLFTFGVSIGLLILYVVGSMVFTERYYILINRQRFERGMLFRTKVHYWPDIADVVIYNISGDMSSMPMIGLVGVKELSFQKTNHRLVPLRKLLRPSAIIDTIPTKYLKELNLNRFLVTLKDILQEKKNMSNN